MLKVVFVHHSCFLVETDSAQLLFDYFPPEAVENIAFGGKIPEFDPDKKLYIFASHCHKDHWSIETLKWQGTLHPDITYVLSKDIRLGNNYLIRNGIDPKIRERVHFTAAMKDYTIDGLKIKTLRSTDAGVAFVVDTDGLCIYHAGDLHWWNSGDLRELNSEVIGKNYKKMMDTFGEKHVDLAFVVLDPRLGEGYAAGMEYFLQHVDADLVFPIHLWQQYDFIDRFKHRPQTLRFADRVVSYDRENIIFNIENE